MTYMIQFSVPSPPPPPMVLSARPLQFQAPPTPHGMGRRL